MPLLCSRVPRPRFCARAGAIGLLVLAGCGQTDAGAEGQLPELVLEHVSAAVPYSERGIVAVLSSDAVCIYDSYGVQVWCGDREWSAPVKIGRSGKGPGEYTRPNRILRGSESSVIVIDLDPARATLFSLDGRVLATARTPPIFQPVGVAGTDLIPGLFTAAFSRVDTALIALAWVSLAEGGVVRVDTLPHPHAFDPDMAARIAPAAGARTAGGALTLYFAQGGFVRYANGASAVERFAPPAHAIELPNEADIEEHRSGMRRAFGNAPQSEIEAFAERPKAALVRGDGTLRFDGRERLWTASARDRIEVSWFDVYDGSTFLGSRQIPGRALGFDILEDLLVVMVETTRIDSEGLPQRVLQWYRISSSAIR